MKIAVQYGLAWPEIPDVYEVSFGGCQIGRLWLAHDGGKQGQPWEWLINLPMSLPDTTRGSATTLEAALDAFARQWGRLVAHVATDRLQRALDLAREVERKQHPAGQRDNEIWRGVAEHVVELTANDLADAAAAGADPARTTANVARLPEQAVTAAPPDPADAVAIEPAATAPVLPHSGVRYPYRHERPRHRSRTIDKHRHPERG